MDSQSPGRIVVRRSPQRVAYYSTTLPAELADALFHHPESLIAGGELLRVNGARRTVRLHWGDERFVLKHYVEPTRRHALKQLVKRSRARSSWLASHRLVDAGIATPRPVACVENRWRELRRDSYLMYPYVEGRTLGDCLKSEPVRASDVRVLWRQLDELWDHLRELRVSLGDANVANFVVTPEHLLWVIDLDKTRFHRLEYLAFRRQRRAWGQLVRSASRQCSALAAAILFGSAAGVQAEPRDAARIRKAA